jgi:acetyltransferase
MHRLEPLFSCSSIAVIGASESSNYGSGPYRTLEALGFTGDYYPVNPRRAEVHGHTAYPDIASIPADIDLAVVVVSRELVNPSLAAAADKGARAAVVISAGFVESDERGAVLQLEMSALARERDLVLVGPNCFGAASLANRCGGFTGSGLHQSRLGNVSVLSSSGGLANEIISYGNARGMGFRHLVSTGNEAGITGADVLDYYVQDSGTEVILAILETVRDASLFVQVAERAAQVGKPLVVLKIGASAKAARSAFTHTGALAGSDAVYSALFRQKGVVRVGDIDELIEVGSLLSRGIGVVRSRGLRRAAVIEISGGGKGLVCDTAAEAGVILPDLTEAGRAALEAALPRGIEPSNPLDTGLTWGGAAMDQVFPLALDTLAREPDVDVVLARFTVPRSDGLGPLHKRLDELTAARHAHPDRLFGVLSRTSDRFSDEFGQVMGDAQIAFLQGYGRGLRALGRVAWYGDFLRLKLQLKLQLQQRRTPSAAVAAHVRVPAGRDVLNEVEAKDLLRSAGIPIVATTLVTSEAAAVEAARAYGYPVAAKVVSPQVVHKSDQGGVRLGLGSDEALVRAFRDLRAIVDGITGGVFEGVAVQPMAGPGLELVIGAHRDPQFGPVVLVGLGGIFVEVLHDVALRVAPLSPFDAESMLDELRGRALLEGARGSSSVNRPALVATLCILAELMLQQPTIASVDLNPVFGYPDGILAVDARVQLEPRDLA